jgi:hypothetical protein
VHPVLEVKLHPLVAAGAGHLTPVFREKSSAPEFLVHAETGERFHARRKQRFSDVESRKFLSLADDNAPARPSEQSRGRASGGSAADDSYVIGQVCHAAIKLTNSRRKQTAQKLFQWTAVAY